MAKGNKERRNSKFTNVGALWRTRNGSKNVVASGTLQMDGRDGESFDILLMKNDKGDNQKRPDLRIVIVSDEDDDDDDSRGRKSKGKTSSKKDDDDDRLPF